MLPLWKIKDYRVAISYYFIKICFFSGPETLERHQSCCFISRSKRVNYTSLLVKKIKDYRVVILFIKFICSFRDFKRKERQYFIVFVGFISRSKRVNYKFQNYKKKSAKKFKNLPNFGAPSAPFFPSLVELVLLVVESVGDGCRFLIVTVFGAELQFGSHSNDITCNASSSVVTFILFK